MGKIRKKLARLSLSVVITAAVAAVSAFNVSAYDSNTKLLKQYEMKKPSSDIVNVGYYGSYIDDIKNAVNRVNAIRKEACDQGVWDPRDSSRRLTPADYVPIKWSYDLEQVAKLRAAEASMYGSHTRPNGLSCFSVDLGADSGWSEVLAWNWENNMVYGINQFYSEKSDWVNKTPNAVTGHYTYMISPSSKYMGLGCFHVNSGASYPNTLCGRFSGYEPSRSGSSGAVKDCYVPIQVQSSKLKDVTVKNVGYTTSTVRASSGTMRPGDTVSYELWAYADYDLKTPVLLYDASWTSSDTKIATVDKYGRITAVNEGTAKITAKCGSITKTVDIKVARADISKCASKLSASGFDYTGKALKATVTITDLGYTLKQGKDYTVEYTSNINIGKATVKITGTGAYKGTKTLTFCIYPTSRRIAGKSRFTTSTEVSKNTFSKADTVILANGMDFADALAGVPLANVYNAPILLTFKDSLPKETLDEIKRLGAKEVIILGGEGAVSAKVANELKSNGLTVDRELSGKTRFETATKIAQRIGLRTGKDPSEVFFVYAFNFADALSVSAVAAEKNAPIIYLKTGGEIDSETKAYLDSIKGGIKNAYVIGGKGVISDNMMKKAGDLLGTAPTRVAGANRYATCVEINKRFADNFTKNVICVAKGLDFPDALSGAVFAAKKKIPLFLADASLNDVQKTYLKAQDLKSLWVLGGTGAVSEQTLKLIKENSI